MRPSFSLIAGALLLAAAPAQAASDRQARGAAELERALEGRTAGEPVDCLRLNDIRSVRIIDRTAILYEAGRGTVYVNRPRGGERSLDRSDVLVTNLYNSRLCSIDIVRLYDPLARMQTGFVSLGEFVPYTKPRPQR